MNFYPNLPVNHQPINACICMLRRVISGLVSNVRVPPCQTPNLLWLSMDGMNKLVLLSSQSTRKQEKRLASSLVLSALSLLASSSPVNQPNQR